MRYSTRTILGPSISVLLRCTALLVIGGLVLTGCGNSGGMGDPEPSGPSFDSGTIAPGDSYSFTFQDTGTEYYCEIHSSVMEGTIVVSSDADSSGTAQVAMRDTSFNPARLRVQPGTKVVWTNEDAMDHTSTSGTPPSDDGGDDPY